MNDWTSPGAGLGLLGVIGSLLSWLFGWKEKSALAEERNAAAAKSAKEAAEKAIAASEDESEGFHQDMREFRDEFRLGLTEMRTVATSVAQQQASQSVVNSFTAKAIESMATRLDRHEEKINDHAATLKLVTELLTLNQRKS